MLTPLCRHVGYLRVGRTFVQPRDELLQSPPFALGIDFHPPVWQISHDPAQTEFRCLPDDERPVADTLDNTGDNGVERCSIRRIGHG